MYTNKTPGRLMDGNIMLQGIHRIILDERHGTYSNDCESGSRILKEKVKKAIIHGNSEETPFKLMDDNVSNITTSLTLYWTLMKFDIYYFSQKRTAKLCGDYRTIHLMSHFLKTFLKVIHSRICGRCGKQMTNTFASEMH